MLKQYHISLSIIVLGLATAACRPVIAIGWPEFLILVVLIAFLLGPTLFKLYRFLDRVRKVGQAEEKKKKDKG